MFCILKMRKCILPTFQNITQIERTIYLFNNSKRRRTALSCRKKLSALLREITSKIKVIFIAWFVSILLEQKKT